jgi:hypothetical protein
MHFGERGGQVYERTGERYPGVGWGGMDAWGGETNNGILDLGTGTEAIVDDGARKLEDPTAVLGHFDGDPRVPLTDLGGPR